MIRSFIRGSLLIPIVGLLLPAASKAAPDSGAPTRLNYGGNTSQLERSWSELNRQLNSLDTLLGPAPDLDPSDDLRAPQLPADLLDANRQANEELSQKDSIPDAPLSLPGSADQDIRVKSVSLKQAIAIAFRNNPELQIQRERIAAQGATVASLSGSYWPTISVFADVEGFQTGSTTFSLTATTPTGLALCLPRKTKKPILRSSIQRTRSKGMTAPSMYPRGRPVCRLQRD